MARRADPSARYRCETCQAETGTPGDCAECADPRRGQFIGLCVNLLAGDGDREAHVEKAQSLRAEARWSDSVFRWLLGAARRRHLENERRRDLLMRKNHKAPKPQELARTVR